MPTRVEIKGVIIPNDYQDIYDWLEWEATSPRKVSQAIADANGDDLEVIINSGGGDVFSGSEIYTMLKEHAADVTVKIVGVAASAASVIAMAGKKVAMSPTAQLMIHNASTITIGDKRDHRHSADFLQTVDAGIANAYRLKTGMTQSELLNLMNKETWLNAQDALAYKFIDEIMFDEGGQLSAVASATTQMLPQSVVEKIKNELLKKKGDVGNVSQTTQTQNVAPNPVVTAGVNTPVQLTAGTVVTPIGGASNASPAVDLAAQERARLKAIDEIAANIDPELVNEAKYGENPMTAEQLALRAMREGKMINNALFGAAVAANKAAGTEGVKPAPQPQNSEKEFDLNNVNDVNTIFNFFAANSQAGRPQNIRRE